MAQALDGTQPGEAEQRRGLLSYLWPQRPSYDALREAAAKEDFSDLDELGFLKVCGHDRSGRRVVLVSAKLYQAKVITTQRTLRYLVHALHSVVQEPYTLVWVHTQATWWSNCPSTWWLWRTYENLPDQYRDNLIQLHVLHCDISFWGSSSFFLPWWSQGLWGKVNWVPRVEFLWDSMDKRALLPHLPQFVLDHDADLEDQPLADYGIVAVKDIGMDMPGAPQRL